MKTFFLILTILTTYTKGLYTTECTVEVPASAVQANGTVDHLITDFQSNPEALFDWAFLGLGQTHDKDKDAFILSIQSTTYRPEEHYSLIVMDVIVPGLHTFKNVQLESEVRDTVVHQQRQVRVDIFYSGSLLKSAFGHFYVTPKGEQRCQLAIDINIRFGWFFNLFVSRKVYRNTIEWRVEQFMNNLSEMTVTGAVAPHTKEL